MFSWLCSAENGCGCGSIAAFSRTAKKSVTTNSFICQWHCYWQADVCIADLCEADIRFKFFAGLTSWLWLSENAKTKLYSTVILSVFSYGYEIWSVTWREGHSREKFENKLPMNLFWSRGRRRRRLEKIACERLRESMKSRRMRWTGNEVLWLRREMRVDFRVEI